MVASAAPRARVMAASRVLAIARFLAMVSLTASPCAVPILPRSRSRLSAPGLSPSQDPHEGHQIALFLGGQVECQDQIEELDRIFEGQAPAVMQVRRALLDAAQRKGLDRPQRGFVDKPLDSEIVHLVIEVERWGMTGGALPLAKEHLFAAPFALGGPGGIQPPLRRELRGRRKVEHVLHLGHMRDLDAIQDHQALLHGMDRIAVKVRGPLFELGKILHRAQAALGAVNLLVEHPPQAGGIEPHPPLLRAVIRIQMELGRRMPVDMAVQAGNPQAGGGTLAVIGRIELFLRQRGEE